MHSFRQLSRCCHRAAGAFPLAASPSINSLPTRSTARLQFYSQSTRRQQQPPSSPLWTLLTVGAIGGGVYLLQSNGNPNDPNPFSALTNLFSNKGTLTNDRWTPITLTSITPVSENTSLFEFKLPRPCQIPISSAIYVKDDQIQAMRAYTPVHSTEKDQATIQLLIKRYSEGQVSRFLHSARPGQAIEMRGPVMIWPGGRPDLEQYDEIGMIAGGTGITAMLPIIHSVLTNHNKRVKLSLLFACQSEDELYFKDELDQLAKTFSDELKVTYVIDRLPAEAETSKDLAAKWEGRIGYVNQGMVQGLLPAPSTAQDKTGAKKSIVLVCGPESMVKHVAGSRGATGDAPVRGVLGAMGYDKSQVFRFPN